VLAELRRDVRDAHRALVEHDLVRFAFGNASAIDRSTGLVVIKPSGVPYDELIAESMVVVDQSGVVVEGDFRPSSDTATHLALYAAFPDVGGIVHTHSHYATVWAQSGREIPCLGTTHADYFHGVIPVTAHLAGTEIETEYEANTGQAIVRRFTDLDPLRMPAVLVAGHASFCWNTSVAAAVETAALLEEVAKLAYHTVSLNAAVEPISDGLRDKHFFRKHGAQAYYGQPVGLRRE
jgi:L-ribulose-5-phosphate 4-epimerase